MILVFIIIWFYGIYLYSKNKKGKGLVIYFFFLTNGLQFIPKDILDGYPINKLTDFAIFYLLFVVLVQLYKGNYFFFKIKEKPLKLYYILFLYLTGIFIWTTLMKKEFFSYSLAVYRNYFLFLSFLLLKELELAELRKLFYNILKITVISCVLYVLQPVFNIKILQGSGISYNETLLGIARYRNIPFIAYFFLIHYTVALRNNGRKITLLLLFIISLLLTQHRGIMIGYFLILVIYVILKGSLKTVLQYTIVGLVFAVIAGSFLSERFTEQNTFSDIEKAITLNYDDEYINGEDGTLTFRFIVLSERYNYLLEHPQLLLTGIGMRHPDSPKDNEFDFNFGSRKKVGNRWVTEQITTGDMVWMTPLLCFGFIGLSLYILITIYMSCFFYLNCKKNKFSMVAFLYYMLLIFISFKNDMLFAPLPLFMVFLTFTIINKSNLFLTRT